MASFLFRPVADLGDAIMNLPLNVASLPAPPAFTVDPVIDSTNDLVGTAITATDGNAAGTQVHQWDREGVAIPGETGATYMPVPADHLQHITRRSQVVFWLTVEAVSNPILITDPGAAGTWPADVSAAQFQVTERRDPADPLVGGGGRRFMTIGTLPSHTGFTLRRYMNTTSVGASSGSPAAASTTYELTTEYVDGQVLYATLMWQRDSDGALQVALPASGTTTGAANDGDSPPQAYPRALSAISGNATRGELVVTILGKYDGSSAAPGAFVNLSSPALTEANANSLMLWWRTNGATTGSPSNGASWGNVPLALAYASMRLQTGAYVRCLAQARKFLDNTDGIWCCPVPGVIRQVQVITFFHILKNFSPHMKVGGAGEVASALTAAEITKADRLVEALAIQAACMCSGNATRSAAVGGVAHPQGNGVNLNFTGFAENVNVGANYQLGPPLQIIAAACYMGVQACSNFLDTFTMSSFRTALIAGGWGTGSNLYKTLNHKNESMSAATAATMYRHKESKWAPSDAAIEAACRNFRYRTAPLSDFGQMLYFTRKPTGPIFDADTGWYTAFPLGDDGGSHGETIGRVMGGIGATAANGWRGTGGTSTTGTLAGTVLGSNAVKDAIPYIGQAPGMIREWSGRDDGSGGGSSQRWSPNYSNWTYLPLLPLLMSIELIGALPHGNVDWEYGLAILKRFRETRAYIMTAGVRGWAHGGALQGGAGGPELYDEAIHKDVTNEGLWDATLPRLIP